MKNSKKKIGKVLLKEIKPKKWQVCWLDPVTRKYVRRTLPYTKFIDAEQEAQRINLALASANGYEAGLERLGHTTEHTVKEAVLEAIKASDANEKSRRDYVYRYNSFSQFLSKNGNGVRLWSDVDEALMAKYLKYSRDQDIAHDTIRLRFSVLRLTANYMARTYPGQYRVVTQGLRLKRRTPSKAELDLETAILSPKQMCALLEWARERDPMAFVCFSLQGLAGLRMQEAAYLREQDIDFEAETVTITRSDAHAPKNRPSYRTIPVCSVVLDVLRDWISGLARHHPDGYLFFTDRNYPSYRFAKDQATRSGCYTSGYVSHRLARLIKSARQEGLDLPEKFIARKLRASFVTAMRVAGADYYDLQRYVGQSAGTVLSNHYDQVDLERLRKISALAHKIVEN